MPSRRFHHKTRAGCLTCKERHIKCDEQRPRCIKCLTRGLRCRFKDSISPHDASPVVGEVAVPVYTVQDLELLLHYCCGANTALARSLGLSHIDGIFELPKIAFRFTFLLRAILALAALHRDYVQGHERGQRADYVAVAAEHINSALPEYQQALRTTSEENCTALLMFSSLLTIYVLAMSRNGLTPFHIDSRTLETDVPYLDLVSWLRLIVGGMTAIKPWIMHILSDTEFGPCLNSELWSTQRLPETADQIERDKILADLERLWMVPDTPSGAEASDSAALYRSSGTKLSFEARTALSETLASLRKIFLWVTFRTDAGLSSISLSSLPTRHHSPVSENQSPSLLPLFLTSALCSSPSTPCSEQARLSQAQPKELSAILVFLHSLPDGFLTLLNQRHPLALILLAYYAVLVQQKDIWWMRGLGDDMLTWVVHELTERSTESTSEDPEKNDPDPCHKENSGSTWLRWIEWPRLLSGNEGLSGTSR